MTKKQSTKCRSTNQVIDDKVRFVLENATPNMKRLMVTSIDVVYDVVKKHAAR